MASKRIMIGGVLHRKVHGLVLPRSIEEHPEKVEFTKPLRRIDGTEGSWFSRDPEMRKRMTPIKVIAYGGEWYSFGAAPELFREHSKQLTLNI